MANSILFEDEKWLRQRLVLSLLTGKTVKVINIRSKNESPGLREHEASLVRLLDKVTNGTHIEINETGTKLFFKPGLLEGGKIDHECNLERSVTYYLEALIYLAPFMKTPLSVMLRGVTSDNIDPSADAVKASILPVLSRFLGTDEGLELKIVKRGARLEGGGELHFRCPHRVKLRPLHLTSPGKVRRIRGCAYALRVSPSIANRIMTGAKRILSQIIPDVYIYTDHRKGEESGESPGYGLHLVAETTDGCFYSGEYFSEPKTEDENLPVSAEELAEKAVNQLIREIYSGGCVDRTSQGVAAMFMSLGDKDVSKLLSGPLTQHTVQLLRHVKQFLGVSFRLEWQRAGTANTSNGNIDDDDDDLRLGGDKVMMTCVGAGYRNINKKLT